jgi:phosphoribosyl-ATP pyrophosphohydrolase
MNEQLFNEIAGWARQTFDKADSVAHCYKLLEEASETLKAYQENDPEKLTEAADCIICLIAIVEKSGNSLHDLIYAIQAKFEKNKVRTWGQPDENGVVKHIEPTYTPTAIASPGEGAVIVEKPECDGNCGMNYCDENGCIERKRNLVEPAPLPASQPDQPSRGIAADGHDQLMQELKKSEIN